MADTALSYSIFARDRTGPGMKSVAGNFEKVGGLGKKLFAGLALAGGAAGAFGFAKGLIEDARESAKVSRLTEAVVKSTGKAANVSADQVSRLSTAISNKTGVDDEAIQSGQNLLLTFTNIRNETGKGNDIFNQASQSITDMTAALNNGDVSAEKIKGSSIMLGKALNDPVKGMTALAKSGVSFTAAQKEQVAAMVKSGDTMGAQKMILAELKKEFGGAAAAASDPAQRATVAWGNLREELGGYLLPAFNKIVGFLVAKVIPGISQFFDNVKNGGGAFASVRSGISQFVGFLQGTVLPAVQRFGAWFKADALPAIQRFATAFWQNLQPAIKAITTAFQTQLRPALEQLLVKLREAWPTIQRVGAILGTVAGFILTRVVPVLIQFYAKYLATTIRVLAQVIGIVAQVVNKLIDLGKWVGQAGASFGRFVAKVSGAMSDFVRAVADGIGKAVKFYIELPGKILKAIGDVGGKLVQKGKDFINGFGRGAIEAARSLPFGMGKVIGWAVDGVAKATDSHSPSRLMMKYGRWFVEGFAIGIKQKTADVVDKAKDLISKLKDKLQEVKDFAREIRSAIVESGNPTSLIDEEDGTFGGLLAKMQAQAAAAKEFVRGIAALRQRGLNETTLGQLRDAGPSSLRTVQALLAGDVGQVNAVQGDIDRTGTLFGNSEAKNKFGIDPSRTQVVKLELNLTGADDDLLKRLRKEIRIKGGNVQVVLGKAS